MSLAIQYESARDAEMRLSGTIVKYDNSPVRVARCEHVEGDDIFRIHFTDLDGKNPQRKFISSRKFDLAPFPLGFINSEYGLVHMERLPTRQQQQGLSARNSSSTGFGNTNPIDFLYVTSSPAFLACVKGEYPSFREVAAKLRDGAFAHAFNRDFALIRDTDLELLIYLYYRKQKVGFIENGRVRLRKVSRCLRELLNELSVPISE